jgi:hypothetical protein
MDMRLTFGHSNNFPLNMSQYKLIFFVPPSARLAVQKAIFAAGAGQYPGYGECAWHTLGTGQFRPAKTANPTIGEPDKLEEVQECRVEILCGNESIVRKSVEALKKYAFHCFLCDLMVRLWHLVADGCWGFREHPYEVPAYEVYKLESL